MPKSLPRVSISLPSIYPEACIKALRNIKDSTRSAYQVILVSPFAPPVDDSNIVWVREEPGGAKGCTPAHARAFSYMTGEYVTAFADDHVFADGWDVLTIAEYEARESNYKNSKRFPAFLLGLRHVWPNHVGTQFGIYYPYFPFIRREDIARIGWYDAAFKRGFGDGDLAFRVWKAGGRCEWSDHHLICVTDEDDRKSGPMFDQSDMDLFIQRWAPVYGRGWDTSTLRGFNIDVIPEVLPALSADKSIFYNNPEFRQQVLSTGWRP